MTENDALNSVEVFKSKFMYFFGQIWDVFLWLTDTHLLLGLLPAIFLGLIVLYHSGRILLWLLPIFAFQEFKEDAWHNGAFAILGWLIVYFIVEILGEDKKKKPEVSAAQLSKGEPRTAENFQETSHSSQDQTSKFQREEVPSD